MPGAHEQHRRKLRGIKTTKDLKLLRPKSGELDPERLKVATKPG
jgi:hypothetical protein